METMKAIHHQLEVTGNSKVVVPGCEPTSALSSVALSAFLAENGCGNALVDLDDALAAIPGSFVKLGNNFNRGNMRQKWYVLPAIDPSCPCQTYEDYYRTLRTLIVDDDPVEEEYDACNVNGMGFCPSPDFDTALPPPTDPYVEEGSFPPGVGVLPPIPPWVSEPEG